MQRSALDMNAALALLSGHDSPLPLLAQRQYVGLLGQLAPNCMIQLSTNSELLALVSKQVANVRKKTRENPAMLAHNYETVDAQGFDATTARNILRSIDQMIEAFPERFIEFISDAK